MDKNPKNQLAAKLKDANNVLVTVSTNPSVDQLAAAIGLTLFLSKLKKHATTVFSGQTPQAIDFLKPEETIENNTDSLRDFIISLDKAKADKIRYKVEDQMVKIFITPYRTSINDQDLVFSQGDFNVDVVIALGVHNKEDIDQAITSHGRILHDATVATVNLKEGSELGTLNWTEPQASSLCEMSVALADLLKANSLDGQMATAFLTGIVAETERFSNDKTSSTTMNASAKLMAAGANQQLVATKLEPPEAEQPATTKPQNPQDEGQGGSPPADAAVDEDGSLRIDHESTIAEDEKPPSAPTEGAPSDELPEPVIPEETDETQQPVSQVSIDDQGELQVEEPKIKQDHRHFLDNPPEVQQDENVFGLTKDDGEKEEKHPGDEIGSKLAGEPPQFGGKLSAAADDSSNEESPLNLPSVNPNAPLLSHDSDKKKHDEPAAKTPPPPTPPPMPPNLPKAAEPADSALPSPTPPPEPSQPVHPPREDNSQPKPAEPAKTGHQFVDMGGKTLEDIEQKVDSPHQGQQKAKLPEPFVRSLDNSTLSGLEERVESPHTKSAPKTEEPASNGQVDYHKIAAEQAAKAMSDKTLGDIEEKLDSPHIKANSPKQEDTPSVIAPAPANDKTSGLSYEPHESEPPETATAGQDDSDDSKATDAPADDTKPSDDAKQTDDQADSTKSDAKEDAASEPAKTQEDPSKPETAEKPEPAGDQKAEPGDEKADEARNAVMQAINQGGDGRDSLPALESVGAVGNMDVSHDGASAGATPAPQTPAQPQHPSPNIHIDDSGNLSFPQNLVPNNGEMPKDATAAPEDASAPPPVPPPMLPPTPQ